MFIRVMLLFAGALALTGCSETKTENSAENGKSGDGKTDEEYSGKEYKGDVKFLDQNWDYGTRMEWWYTSQGSRVVPYKWFMALEIPDSEKLVTSKENLDQMRFVSWPADEEWNPDGLPIGFVKDVDATTKEAHFGFTCAACHTSLVKKDDTVVLIEGGPAHSDFDGFITQIGKSLEATLADNAKFARFAERVVGKDAEAAVVDDLKAKVQAASAPLNKRLTVNHPPHPNGFARLDAFGNIFNEGSVFAINVAENAKDANAPVSYPVLWDTPQHDVVQWNGAAVNAGIGPYTRNVGEVVGVFGGLRISEREVLGEKKLKFDHHVKIKGLERLEEILTSLWSPQWPEEILGEIDKDKAKNGKAIFNKSCVGCHHIIADRKDLNRHIGELMVSVQELGTDPLAATNPFESMSKTGLLEGHSKIPLLQVLPSQEIIRSLDAEAVIDLGPEASTGSVVGVGVLGILREELGLLKVIKGLPAYIKAAKTYKPTEPSYKARPLNGIWASAPFLHNGSVPNLWELLKKPEDRAKKFHVGTWKMDVENVGFETAEGDNTTELDTSVLGNSNAGHDYGTGLTDAEKRELIEYIKSL